MRVLATGGAGYIGSHAVLRLLAAGHDVVVLDNFSRGHPEAVRTAERAAHQRSPAPGRLTLAEGDIADRPKVERLLIAHEIETVLHFAGLAYVGESVDRPLDYYRVNTAGTAALLDAIAGVPAVQRFVLSSTSAVYGEPEGVSGALTEDTLPHPINPYGSSKLMAERIVADFVAMQRRRALPFAAACLRYSNVAGCDAGGALGEHHDPETHIIPIILECALGRRPLSRNTFTIFGDDYPNTPDGTCIRDYIHVDDLVDAHLHVTTALDPARHDALTYNVGIGQGLSIRAILASVKRVTGITVPTALGPRRPGDPGLLYADPARIQRDLGWHARITDIDAMVASAYRWFAAHPAGYVHA
ncbi:UDP-glucose 4-epimerase GalE [soil metagenome]